MRVVTLCLLVIGCDSVPAAEPPAVPEPQPAAVDEVKVRDLMGARHGIDKQRFAAAGGYSPAAIPLYARILADPGEDWRVVAAVLGVLAHPEMKGDRAPALDPCVVRLADPHPMVRLFAAELLAKIGTARDLAPVAVLLSDKEPDVRFAAARTLAAVGDRRALAAMDTWLAGLPPTTSPALPARAREYVAGQRDKLKERLDKEEKEKAKKPPAK